MGNASSKGGAGPVIVAEAIEPLPRYSDICAILGGVNKREHMILKASTGVGFGGGKFTVKDCKGDGSNTLIKAEVGVSGAARGAYAPCIHSRRRARAYTHTHTR